jgi:SprB repeat/Secretion system C-terminal sorting domain
MNKNYFALALAWVCSFSMLFARTEFAGDCGTTFRLFADQNYNNTTYYVNNNRSTEPFTVQGCSYGSNFAGKNIGTIHTSFSLLDVMMTTWESYDDDVTNGNFYYRIYPAGQTAPAFTKVVIAQQLPSTSDGTYEFRSFKWEPNRDLLCGLLPNTAYKFEVYFEANVNLGTLSDARDGLGNLLPIAANEPKTKILATPINSADFATGALPSLTLTNTATPTSSNTATDGTATVTTAGGTAPYTYLWSNGKTTATINGLSAGCYHVTVTDQTGCMKNTTQICLQSANNTACNTFTASTTAVNIGCYGGNNGTATTNLSGGTAPFSYTWSNGARTASINNLVAGSYTITVADANSCFKTSTVTITQPAPIAISFTENSGNVTLIAINGTAPYAASWSPVVVFASNSNGMSAVNVKKGNYNVTVTDSKGCNTTKTIAVTAAVCGTMTVTVSQDPIQCSSTEYGKIMATVVGGTSPYTYQWTGGQSGQTLAWTKTGAYTVTVTDAVGCTALGTGTLSAPAPIAINLTTTNETSVGAKNGSATLALSGGKTPFSASWAGINPSGYTAWSGGQDAKTINGLAAGTYTVTVYDANWCNNTQNFTITADAVSNPCTGFSANLTPINATNGNNGSINMTIQQGTTPFTIIWSNNTTISQLTTRTIALPNLAAGNYKATITDANNCNFITSSVTIVGAPTTTCGVVVTLLPNVKCGQDFGEIGATVTGGTAPYTYNWSNGYQSAKQYWTAVGNYTVTVTDKNGCTATATKELKWLPYSISLNTTDETAINAKDGFASVSPSGGISPYTAAWSGANLSEWNKNTVSNLAKGTYSVTVYDAYWCSVTANFTINTGSGNSACTGFNATTTSTKAVGTNNGTAQVTITDTRSGIHNYTTLWSTGATTAQITGLAQGNYMVTVTDAQNTNCKIIRAVTVDYTAVATNCNGFTAAVAAKPIQCGGDTHGEIGATTTGGIAPFTYNWSNGQSGQILLWTQTGNYTVTVTDKNGCTATGTGALTAPPLLIANLSVTSNNAVVAPAGGNGDYKASWSGDNFQVWNATSVSGLAAGNYKVIVYDSKWCAIEKTFTIASLTPRQLAADPNVARIRVYPNPVSEYLYLQLQEISVSTPATCIFYDINGTVVRTETCTKNDWIDMTGMIEGMYYLQVQCNGRLFTRQILVQHK